jgi:hypothetical protein
MICDTLERSTEIIAKLDQVSGWGALDENARALCSKIAGSATDVAFPGGLIPSMGPAGNLRVYALTASDREWRQLGPLLLSFAGPTLTSFAGLLAQLRTGDLFEDIIREANARCVGLLDFPQDGDAAAQALRALVRLQDTWSRAPKMDGKPTEPTSWLLADFQDHINVGRREAATAVIERLKSELRLDTLNIRFLEVQLLAAFSDWAAIVSMAGIRDLCLARRPPSVTVTLLQAFYEVELKDVFSSEDLVASKLKYEETTRALVQPLLLVPPPAGLTDGGWRTLAMEAIVDGDRPDIVAALQGHQDKIGWLAAHVASPDADERGSAALEPTTGLDAARSALMEADGLNSISAVNSVLARLENLSKDDLEKLKSAEPFRSALREMTAGSNLSFARPENWVEWFQRIEEPGFYEALEVARQGKDEWPIGDREADPVSTRRLVAQLERVQGDTLAGERAADALPFLVAWLLRDPEYPRSAMAPVYSILLTLFALSDRRGRRIYESSGLLVSALLSIGLSEKSYCALLEDVEEMLGAGLGINSMYWLLDVLEDTLRFPAPAVEAREAFWHGTLAKIEPLRSRLTALQRASISELAVSLGWPQTTMQPIASGEGSGNRDRLPSGLKIAIYTLTESSSRQAKSALESSLPSVVVDCSADHVGNQRLKAMAENADIFVVTSSSAKHAATQYILQHRGDRPLLYAQGRGFTSILRSIEDHLSGGAND